jgi:cyclopropane fatty-acyl-phospholipid synthase-like methyltransferase
MNDVRRPPDAVTQQVADYYRDTTADSYLTWGGESLALHLGLSDDDAPITERPTLDRALLRMNAWLADRAGIGDGARVLDAGCGVGGSSIWLARERGARVTGVTLDPGQAAMARENAVARGAAGARFEVADFAQTGFPRASFDVVWNMESLCHARDPRAYLAHVAELLRPGGRFVCVEVFRADRDAHDEVDAMCEGWVLPALMTLDEAAAMLRDLGFASVETEDLTARVLPSATVMGSVSFEEILRHELSVMQGAAPRPALVRHYRASLAAASALGLGSVRYAYLGATRPA